MSEDMMNIETLDRIDNGKQKGTTDNDPTLDLFTKRKRGGAARTPTEKIYSTSISIVSVVFSASSASCARLSSALTAL